MNTVTVSPSQTSTGSYHLWFIPSGAAHGILSRTIRELARELNGPVFEPHVSLIGSLDGTEKELARRTEELAQELRPFRIVLTEFSYRDDHFQCLFVSVEQTPPIMNANALARDLFFGKPDQAYFPHVSLAYGSFPDSRKRQIIATLPPDVRAGFDVTTLHLIRAETPHPKTWYDVATFPIR